MKIGSALIADDESGRIREDWLAAVGADLAGLRTGKADVAIVSSGAIAVGRRDLGLSGSRLALSQKQAAAARGQIRLAHAWQQALGPHGVRVAQILLTLSDTEERRRHLNARATVEALFGFGVVPVINENDTVATEEIRYGDNDRLAARVAQMIGADMLVLLSDVDGLYDADPRVHAGATLVPVVGEVTPEIERMAGNPLPGHSSGGMVTKLEAARIAMSAGCAMVIADGKPQRPLARLADGARCTWFLPSLAPSDARKRWIAASVEDAGRLVVDGGAAAALRSGRSLLPVGVVEVGGDFERGDVVLVVAGDLSPVARGLAAYSSGDARRIMGRRSREIEAVLGYRGRDEMIHRDDLVLDPSGTGSRPA